MSKMWHVSLDGTRAEIRDVVVSLRVIRKPGQRWPSADWKIYTKTIAVWNIPGLVLEIIKQVRK